MCSGWVLRVGRPGAVLRVVVAAVAAAVAVAVWSSAAWAAAPEFLAADSGSNLAAVRLLAVGEGQTKAGPPVQAYDSDGDTLTYSLSDGDPFHATFFTIDDSTGQISLKSNTRSGVYRVRVSAADATDTATVDVTIHVTSSGHYPWEDAWVEARSMTAGDGSANDWFGVSVDADDEVIVVGAPWADSSTVTGSGDWAGSGAVYVFDADSGAQLARLDSPVTAGGGSFGWNVELVGDAIFVSAPRETVSSVSSAGRVYLFNKPAGGWVDDNTADATFEPGPTSAPHADQTNKYMAGTGLGPVEFGSGLAVSNDGNTLVVGAEEWENVPALPMGGGYTDSNLVHLYYNGGNGLDRDGALFVFTKPSTGWASSINTDASGVVRLYAGSREWRFAQLGKTIAISDDGGTIAASAMGAEQAEGWVYIFTKPETGWTNTTSTDTPVRLSVTNRHRNQRLGSKGLDISGDGSTVVASASVAWRKGAADDSQIPDDAVGAAFVFARPADGWEDATQTAKLTTFGHKYDMFGGGVAISSAGDKIAVTNSDSRSSNFRGSAYVYTKPAGGWADDTDGVGDNVRVLTAAAADSNARQRYGFGGRGLAFVGDDALVVGQLAQIWALHKRDGVSSPPAGWTVYGDNTDHNNRANVPQGSAYLFKLRTAAQQTQQPVVQPPPPPPDDPEPPEPPEPPPAPEFADVDEGSVHAESIEEVAVLGITSGTSATMFSPSEPVSRAQMASFVARTWEAAGRECPSSGASYFDDLPAGSTHAAGIDCVSALGVARGTAERMFSPSAPVSRGQMASFLANAWRQAGRTCPASDASSIFDDVAAGSTHAESIGCIAALGITRGTAAGMFSPSESVTRAQMATFLARFYEELTDTA